MVRRDQDTRPRCGNLVHGLSAVLLIVLLSTWHTDGIGLSRVWRPVSVSWIGDASEYRYRLGTRDRPCTLQEGELGE